MIRFLATLLVALCTTLAHGAANDFVFTQRNQFDTGPVSRLPPQPTTGPGLFHFDNTTFAGSWVTLSGHLQISSGVLGLTFTPFSGAFSDLSGTPSTFAPSAHVHDAADITSGTLADARIPALAISKTTGLQAAIDAKFTTPAGTTAQYVRGDGSLATLPASTAFDFGFPSARTLAVSTSYQATNTAKAAIITPSYSCTNATTVLAASACTLQVRVHTSAVTCSTGTVYYTVSQTVNLGVLLTQAQTVPQSINLPAGAHFIICPTAGTFTVSTVEQTAG